MLVAMVAAYFLGQFPTADLVAGDRARGGSGNPGASNVYRQAGRRAGITVFVGDALKGAAATAIGWLATGDRTVAGACAFLAVAGHCFPVLRRFRGGKGVATAFGAITVLQPAAAAAATITWAVVARTTHKASLGSLAAIIAAAVVLAVVRPDAGELLGLAGTAALVVVRHAGNINRLIRGEERSLR